ncbi:MAG: hypothetical protein H0W50_09540 [Parachlamydiaceae bacterium]|nr:hypothetical protein [Parachlamydiaceae bacterium]
MANYTNIPRILPCFEPEVDHLPHVEITARLLAKILPDDLFSDKLTTNEKEQFQLLLPLVTSASCPKNPNKMSFFFLAKYRSSSFKFFFEMISHWLISGKRLNIVLINSTNFQMPDISDEIMTLCELVISVTDDEELSQIQTYLPIIENEIKMGLESSYYARRILEVKGLAADAKTASIHEHIAYLAKRLPKAFDRDILAEMQHVLVMSREEFKAQRSSRHLSRIISVQYLFRKALRIAIKEQPDQRHISLKVFKSEIQLPKGKKNVLSILMTLSFLKDKELLDKKHILKVIQSHIPEATSVENSFFVDRRSMESVSTIYLEIVKSDGLDFTAEEITLLRETLPKDLKDNIGHLMHPVFMPCNEEEIMRNILSLSNEIRYLRDIPQVIITFHEQTYTQLSFTVTMVHLVRKNNDSIPKIFNGNSSLEYIYDRSKPIGTLRNKHPKEAVVFWVKLPKDLFLRRDHSIDLYKARHAVVTDLSSLIGEFRDFNGGMLTKQHELLTSLRELLGGDFRYNELLLENFFFSLMPVTMRSLLEPEALKTLFVMLLNTIEHGFSEGCSYRIRQNLDFIFVLIKIEKSEQKEQLRAALQKFNLHSTELAHMSLKAHEVNYSGYIYRCDEPLKQQKFLQSVQTAVGSANASASCTMS